METKPGLEHKLNLAVMQTWGAQLAPAQPWGWRALESLECTQQMLPWEVIQQPALLLFQAW